MEDLGFAIYTLCEEGKPILVNYHYCNYEFMPTKHNILFSDSNFMFGGHFIIMLSELFLYFTLVLLYVKAN